MTKYLSIFKNKRLLRDSALLRSSLGAAFGISIILQNLLTVRELTATVFVFAVFLISMLTDGYLYGICATLISVLGINFAFTFPYFAFNFAIPENALSALVMLVVSIMTSTLTTKLKAWEALRAETEMEKHRANLMRAVSHDLRTPLTTIYGSSSAIIENYDILTDDQKKTMILGISTDAEWLNRIVENLLSVTGLRNGSLKLIKTLTMPDELIDSVCLKFRKRYPDTHIELELTDETLFVPMDALLIEQVLINLLDNAVLHAEGMTRLVLGVEKMGNTALFSVTDNGCGIECERLDDLIREKHRDPDAGADDRKRNAGIGLSVCASIVKAHGSELKAENLPTGGARFSFVLDTEDITDE